MNFLIFDQVVMISPLEVCYLIRTLLTIVLVLSGCWPPGCPDNEAFVDPRYFRCECSRLRQTHRLDNDAKIRIWWAHSS